ncbi:hypothetical protein BKA65DRAFT_518366 [Rhexocercosporidium sp. MPI-PUGE-AT-0058]|nr:hypothetical protein BKA65DRAFT_518366 [Rhexocercosporidium sp. MPI-PUGE-AT-0058]
MASSRGHLITLPPGFITVHILQALFAFIIIPLDILMIVENMYVNYAQYVVLVTAIITLIAMAYIIVATYIAPKIYNYWAILGLELFFLGAWADGFLHSMGASFSPNGGCILLWNGPDQWYKELCEDHTNDSIYHAASISSRIVMGLAGILLILWLTSFITVCVGIARHRKAGGRCLYGSEEVVLRQKGSGAHA